VEAKIGKYHQPDDFKCLQYPKITYSITLFALYYFISPCFHKKLQRGIILLPYYGVKLYEEIK